MRICWALAVIALPTSCQQAAVERGSEKAVERSPVAHAEDSKATARSAIRPASSQQQTTFAEPPAEDLAGGQLVEETWDAISMQGTRVGYARTTVANVTEHGQDVVRTSSFVCVVLAREGQAAEQTMSLTSWDTPDGRFVRFESQMKSGPSQMIMSGRVRDGKIVFAAEQPKIGPSQPFGTKWQDDWGGPFAVEQSLRRQPLKAGETRTVHCLLPVLNVPGDVRLQALGEETVEMPGATQKLLKVRTITDAGQQQIEELRWLDERGESLKSVMPTLGQESIRTTKAEALAPAAPTKPLDVMAASAIPVKGKLVPSVTTKRAVYRARVKSGPIAGLFKDCPSQRVKNINDQTAELTVLAVRPDGRAVNSTSQPPMEGDLQANNFIQSGDRLIGQMAAQVAPRETDPWKTACALESFVQGAVKNKNYSQAFATAADVARTLEGDCTEHSLLFAALCRARKIPVRAALGLIYYPPKHGFAYHMWNEVWIDDRWVPMDSTLGRGGIGADHIKLGDSNFAGASPMADLLTVAQAFGRLELDVLEIE